MQRICLCFCGLFVATFLPLNRCLAQNTTSPARVLGITFGFAHRDRVSVSPSFADSTDTGRSSEKEALALEVALAVGPGDDPILGNIDGVFTEADGSQSLHGWACNQGQTESIAVDLYVNGSAQVGTGIGRYLANLPSEPAVAAACGSTGTQYRFKIPLDAVMAQYATALIYVHGISNDPNELNSLLANSGQFQVPNPQVLGYIDGVSTVTNGTLAIRGWACNAFDPRSLSVDLYTNGPAGNGAYIGRFSANVTSESAVAQSCSSNGTAYRFEIPIAPYRYPNVSYSYDFSGASIYVHGISNYADEVNALLTGSGSYNLPGLPHSAKHPIKMVDCTVLGNCVNINQAPSKYAYGPAIVKTTDGVYHQFFCAVGNVGSGSGAGTDTVRYTESPDGIHWTSPVIKVTATESIAGGTRDFAACDPSVVYFGSYYYLFYGSTFLSPNGNKLTNIQVARASTIDGNYLVYTDRNTWETTPADPKMLITPLLDVPGYGAGQPTVIVQNGSLQLWYTDDTAQGPSVYMLSSTDPVTWVTCTAARTDLLVTNVDVKYDDAKGQYTAYFGNENSAEGQLLTETSDDGMHWTNYTFANVSDASNVYHVESVGASGDMEGHAIAGDPVLLGYGAPINLYSVTDPSQSYGNWNLYGVFTLGSQ